jgi:hypothetical protein
LCHALPVLREIVEEYAAFSANHRRLEEEVILPAARQWLTEETGTSWTRRPWKADLKASFLTTVLFFAWRRVAFLFILTPIRLIRRALSRALVENTAITTIVT